MSWPWVSQVFSGRSTPACRARAAGVAWLGGERWLEWKEAGVEEEADGRSAAPADGCSSGGPRRAPRFRAGWAGDVWDPATSMPAADNAKRFASEADGAIVEH